MIHSRMEVKLEFCGGAESHNNGEKIMTMQFPEDTSLRDIFRMLRGGDMLQDVDNLIESEDQVKAGVLVLINDADWELFGCADYIIGKKDRITFISTLHGG